MNKSKSIKELATAMAMAQSELENASKSSVNPHYKSRYADLAEVLNTIRPVFSKNGLSVMQFPSFADGIAHVETLLAHKSGEWISNTSSAPVSKQDAQGVGSATTYLRRYSLAALGIAQEDDDANASVGRPKSSVIDAKRAAEINALIEQTGTNLEKFLTAFSAKSVESLDADQADRAMQILKVKLEKAAKSE